MLKQLVDKYWSWKRGRAAKTISDAYLRTAPQGQPPSTDPAINNYYAMLREKPATLSPRQLAAQHVHQATIARANDPPSTEIGIDGAMGHFAEPTVRVHTTLPPMKGIDE